MTKPPQLERLASGQLTPRVRERIAGFARVRMRDGATKVQIAAECGVRPAAVLSALRAYPPVCPNCGTPV